MEDALEAEQMFRWCDQLEKSEAFREVFLKELEWRRDEAEGSGTDVSKSPAERAEHHRAYHLAKDLLKLVGERKAGAAAVLAQWSEQHGEKFSGLADDQHV